MKKLFQNVVGQEGAISILSAQIESENLSHAYIFSGKEGMGKDFLARQFAKYILCENREDDECENCTRFEKGVHPDFIYVDGTNGIKIETAREVIKRINLSPSLSKYKVLLLSGAENLGLEAANAMLKTFEEPPADSVIIMTATSEKSLPETIVSRGQKIKLKEIPAEDLKKIFSKDALKENLGKIISYSEGSIGEVKKMIEDSDYLLKKEKLAEKVEKILLSGSVIEKFKILEDANKDKYIKELLSLFMFVSVGALKKKLSGEDVEFFSEICEKTANHYQTEDLVKIIQKTLKIYENLGYNVNLKLALEEIVLEGQASFTE